MKAMKLVFLALPLMLLGVGCDISKDHPKDKTTTETTIKEDSTKEASTKDSSETVSPERVTQLSEAIDYRIAINDLNKEFEKAMNDLAMIINKDSTLSTSKDSYKNDLIYLRSVTIKYDDLKPSKDPGYNQEETHKLILDSMKTMRDAISIQYASIDNIASEDFMRGLTLTNEASNKFIEAMKTLK
ncbi:hypothetical protein EXW51_19060 [Bacillus mycoides]|uniref:hypothetical protein n=1 Tax=Bacillus mycoides TaxID=1405 RepID=UPI001C01C4F5|nr:hypothetical protein [Bacillus mycoides]QWH29943.1 hypothetical protein EXW51_19060 [Bacillus mycoides]